MSKDREGGVQYLDKDKQQLMDAVDTFRERVEKEYVSDFVILGVNKNLGGFFTMLNVGDDLEKVNLVLDMTKQTILDMIMGSAAMYFDEEITNYDFEEREAEEGTNAEAEGGHEDGE